MRFKIGQKVVCVSLDINRHLIKDRIYTIQGALNCCFQIVDVGIGRIDGTHCSRCGKHINNKSDGIKWFNNTFFAPLIEDHEEEAETAVKELVKEVLEPIKLEI